MPLSSTSTLAFGIAAAGAFIGAGLFFGLRGRAADSDVRGAVTSVAAGSATTASAVHVSAAAVDLGTARAEVARQLDGFRTTLRDKCWAPSAARAAAPDRGSFTFEYTFDASGAEVARGIHSDQGKARNDVAFCLTGETPAVSIAPQGGSVHVSVPLSLP